MFLKVIFVTKVDPIDSILFTNKTTKWKQQFSNRDRRFLRWFKLCKRLLKNRGEQVVLAYPYKLYVLLLPSGACESFPNFKIQTAVTQLTSAWYCSVYLLFFLPSPPQSSFSTCPCWILLAQLLYPPLASVLYIQLIIEWCKSRSSHN